MSTHSGVGVERHEHGRMLRNWREERDSAVLYETLARLERNPRLRRVFGKLAESEREHSAYWEERIRAQGGAVPPFHPSWRARFLMRLAGRFGVAFVVPSIATRELADWDRYAAQEDASRAGLSREERGHAAVMRRVATYGHEESEQEPHGAGSLANNLRAAVLGANDGLASNFCLLMGVAGGGVSTSTLILTGVAGLVAGACSMALGEWLSVTNAREMARSQIDANAKELHSTTAWKREELTLLHEARGLAPEEAQRASERVMAQDPEAVRSLIAEERVIALTGLANNPVRAAAYSFVLVALGACVPLLPFLLASAAHAIIGSIVLSLLALFAIGLATSLFNGRSPVFSGLRQVCVGAAAALVAYSAGRLVGAAVG